VDALAGVDGHDLLAGRAPRERVFAEKTFHSYYDPMRAVRSPVAKLIVNFGVGFRVEVPADVTEGPIFRSDPGRYTGGPHPVAELYDLRADPLERHNLLNGDARPAPFEELRAALLAWMRDGDDPLLGARGPLTAPQHRQALHLLGA
jgi:arylsulfatase A-like enzyme